MTSTPLDCAAGTPGAGGPGPGPSMRGKRVLLIMAKEPRAGRVKTRMVPPLAAAEAARLYRAFLADTVALAAGLEGVEAGVAYSPPSALGYFRRIVPDDFLLRPQPRGGLGTRLRRLCDDLFREGAAAVCLMNSDGPDLPRPYLRKAFTLLGSGAADVVFGPNTDGGYYLVGLTRPADLFTGVPWSTPRVLEASLEKAASAGLRHALLPEWADLDDADDLRRAVERWSSGHTPPPPHTGPLAVRLFASRDIP